ncbi:MAG: FAD synthase [Candidatus Woesearchaeota archaeon]|nr:FAD synthase [Candidatus Woesearchaeota archaeon]
MKKVMVFGSFDLIHPGHINMFQQAKEHGDYLIVVVALDKVIEKVKGKKPMIAQQERLSDVAQLRLVDEALLGHPTDRYANIKKVKPDVICLGYDQYHFVDKLQDKLNEFGFDTQVIRLKPYKEEKYKSSKLKKK